MPDSEKKTPPPMNAKELSELIEITRKREYDEHQKAFKNPTVCMQAVFHYARMLATRLHEANERISRLEARLLAFESWRDNSTREAKAMFEQFEKEAKSNPELARMLPILEPPKKEATPANGSEKAIEVVTVQQPVKTSKKEERAK